jgi:hypothetical protein
MAVAAISPTRISSRRIMPRVKTPTTAMATKVTACIHESKLVGAMFFTGIDARLRPITITIAPVTTGGIRRSIHRVPAAMTISAIAA